LGTLGFPGNVSYNVLVRGDSASATVRITTLFAPAGAAEQCNTTGTLERRLLSQIKAMAERQPDR
jgi:hypothetical protein